MATSRRASGHCPPLNSAAGKAELHTCHCCLCQWQSSETRDVATCTTSQQTMMRKVRVCSSVDLNRATSRYAYHTLQQHHILSTWRISVATTGLWCCFPELQPGPSAGSFQADLALTGKDLPTVQNKKSYASKARNCYQFYTVDGHGALLDAGEVPKRVYLATRQFGKANFADNKEAGQNN